MVDREIVYFKLKRILNIIEKTYRMISVGNTGVIFFILLHISFERP